MKIAKTWAEVHNAALNSPKQPKKYALFNGKEKVMQAEYALLLHKRKEMIREGRLGYLLTIKPI